MKYLHLIWAALFRSKTRTLLTLLSVVTAFLLFGMLDSVRVAFNSGGQVAGHNRLITSSRLSITQMLPYSLVEQIRATLNPQLKVEGLLRTMYDPRNNLANEVSEQLTQHFGDTLYNHGLSPNSLKFRGK